jgi:hypothetical protein
VPIVNGYTTLALLKARLDIATADTGDDSILEAIVTAVSRQIDDYCRRRFYAVSETRYFMARRHDRILVDDLLSVSALLTDEDGDRTYETTWAVTDYDLAPDNAQLESQPRPYWEIRATPDGDYCFPVGIPRGIKITGSWGFSATTPGVVAEACLWQSARVFRASEMPTGTAGGGEFETHMVGGEFQTRTVAAGLHPFVRTMLNPYRRMVV